MSVETAHVELAIETVKTAERPFPSARCAALGCAAILCADCPFIRLRAMIDETNLPDSPDQLAKQTDNGADLGFKSLILDIDHPVASTDINIAGIEKTTTPPPVEVKNTTLTYLERLMDDSIKSVVADSLSQPVGHIQPEIHELSSGDSERSVEPVAMAITLEERGPIVSRFEDSVIEQAIVNVAKLADTPDIIIVGNEVLDSAELTLDEVIFCDVTEQPPLLEDGEILVADFAPDKVDDIQVAIVEMIDNSTTLPVNGLPEDAVQIDESKVIMPLATVPKSETPYSPTPITIDEYIATVEQVDESPEVIAEVVDVVTGSAVTSEILEMPQIYDLATSDEPDGGLEQPEDELPEVSIIIERTIGYRADDLIPYQVLMVEATALLDGKDRLDWERGTGRVTRSTLISATTELLRQLAIHALRAKIYLPLKV